MLDSSLTLRDAIKFLAEMDLINVGELAEAAISKRSKVARQPKNHPGSDLVNGVEIKYSRTNRTSSRGNKAEVNNAWISKKNKSTVIAAVVTETVTNKTYFFLIPFKAFKTYKGNALRVPFAIDGNPSRSNRCIVNVWDYEVSSYGRLVKKISEIC